MFCQSCGKTITENALFCFRCGAKQEAIIPEPEPDPLPDLQPPSPPPPSPLPSVPILETTPEPPLQPVSVNPVVQPQQPLFEGNCLHCGFEMPEGLEFCGKCGKKAGTVPPPKPKKFCQGCGMELGEGLRFCQKCGNQIPGTAFRLPNDIKLDSASLDNIKGIMKIMNKQRIAFIAASLIGIIALLLPMINVNLSTMSQAEQRYLTNTLVTNWFADAVGWVVLLCVIIPMILCFLGDRTQPLGKRKFISIASGAIIIFIDIVRINAFNEIVFHYGDYLRIGFGMYIMLISAAAFCVLPFIKKLEN